VERCDGCGFVWAEVPADDIGRRIEQGAEEAAALCLDAPTGRPEPSRWSSLEYAAHMRDVLLHVRDRVVIALVEDDATFKPLYREQRVDFGLYRFDVPEVVTAELVMAAGLYARTFSCLDEAQLARSCVYTFPVAATRSVLWLGQQAVHEVEHHTGDILANAHHR
jgi:hypothetical protein